MTGSGFGELARHGAMLAAALSTTGRGRIVLIVVGTWLGFIGGSAWWEGTKHAWVFLLLGGALLALAALGALRARRERAASRQRNLGGVLGLVLMLLAGALLIWRRRKAVRAPAAAVSSPVASDPTSPSATEAAQISAAEAGRRGLSGLVAALPAMFWGTVRGLLGGAFFFGFVGLLLGMMTVASAQWFVELPTWLVWTSVIAAPLVLGIAGGYVGTIRGFLSSLARALVERGVVPAIYALVRPALARVASSVAVRTDPLTRHETVARIHAHVKDTLTHADATPPAGVLERFERRLAERTHTWLALASIASAADADDRTAALAELEQRGVLGIEANLAGAIESAYRTQALIAIAIATAVLAVPWIVHVVIS